MSAPGKKKPGASAPGQHGLSSLKRHYNPDILTKAASEYLRRKWGLVPLRDKRPQGMQWNKPANLLRTQAQVTQALAEGANGLGVALGLAGLCSFDPDDLKRTTAGLACMGLDVEALLDAGWRVHSGQPNRGRAMYALPKGEPLKWMRLRVRLPPSKVDPHGPRDSVILFELRAGDLQDALPGSWHPGSRQHYKADEPPTPMPPVPKPLLTLWRRWQKDRRVVEAELYEAFGVPPEQRAYQLGDDSKKLDFPSGKRSAFNEKHSVEDILSDHGYEQHADGTWSHPGATGAPGCRPVPGKDGLWQSFNGGDPLCGTFDAWIANVVLNFDGDLKAANLATRSNDFEALDDKPTRAKGSRLVTESASDVQMRATRWLWQGWLAKGYLHLISGETGAGKSTWLANAAARITDGKPFPGESPEHAKARGKQRVLWLGAEDGAEELSKPRFVASDGDVQRLFFVRGVLREGERDTFSMQDDLATVRNELERAEEAGRPFAALIVDPVTAYLAGGKEARKVDMADNGQLRSILTPWSELARDTGLAVLLVTNLTKDAQRHLLHRALGAGAFTHIVRSYVAIVQLEAEGPHARALVQVKNQLPGAALGGIRWTSAIKQVGTDEEDGQAIFGTYPTWGDFDPTLNASSIAGGSRGPQSQYGPVMRAWVLAHWGGNKAEWKPVDEVKPAALLATRASLDWWDRHSKEYLEKKNVGGDWFYRPAAAI